MTVRDKYKEIDNKYGLSDSVREIKYMDIYAALWYRETSEFADKAVAIYGAGENTDVLLKLLTLWNESGKVGFIIDNNKSGSYKGITVISEKELDASAVKLVWISSFKYRMEMKKSIRENFPDIKCIEPCELIEKEIKLDRQTDISRTSGLNKYKWFADRLIERKIAEEENTRIEVSQDLIAGYYCVKDWISLEKEINAYIKNKYPEYEKYRDLLSDVKAFVEDIKHRISRRKNKAWFVYFLDALSIYDAEKMPFLSEWKKGALEFTQYKNEYPTTRELVMGMFTGWRPFEDVTYKNRRIQYEDSNLLGYICDNSIRIKFLTENNRLWENFDAINSYVNKREENCVISEVIFNALCELADDEETQFILAHTYTTIHPPHMTPTTLFMEYDRVNDTKKAHRAYFEQAIKYTDELVHYYTDLLDDCRNVTQVVMGDHGVDADMEYCYAVNPKPYPNKAAQWEMEIMSPELIIRDADIEPGVDDHLVSTNQLADILYAIVRRKDPRECLEYKDVIPIEIVPGYDKNWLMTGVRSRNYYLAIAAAGCMSKKYMYLNLETGEDLYYMIDGRQMTPVDDEKTKKTIRDSLGENEIKNNKFPESILEDSFFDEHNRIYQDKSIEWG